MQTKGSRLLKLGPASRAFVEAVKQIPEVQLVILHYGDYPRIWTIIDAPRLEEVVSGKIYDLEYEANKLGDEGIGFRLINVKELPHGIAGLHIEGMPVLFQRSNEASGSVGDAGMIQNVSATGRIRPMQTKRVKRVHLGPVARFFVEAAKQIPEVQLVLLQDSDGDDYRIWTIIDATPFEEAPRRAVYEREAEALRQGDEDIGFRLVNVRELRNGLADLHIEGMPVLFERKP